MGTKSPSSPRSAAAEAVLQEGPLSAAEAERAVASPERGAVVVMQGTVRGTEDGRPIDAIVYEAYEPMALKVMARVVEEASRRWSIRVVVRHRVGPVPVGEAAVIVACAGVHREEAFAGCRFVIDEVKAKAPIWKRFPSRS